MSVFDRRRFEPRPCAARPVIGVLCCNEVSERPIQAVATRFIEPLVTYAGVTVVLIPAVASACDAIALASRLDGLLLTGSRSNVAGMRYGVAEADTGPLDEQRDAVALELAARMIETGRSVFGICRGLQELNVLFGGTLTDAMPDHHHRGASGPIAYEDLFDHHHDVDLLAGGLLARTTDASRLTVNSVHRQGIDRLGEGLHIEARAADDGLIEAFSARPCGGDVLAVQWHPEWDAARIPASRAFFGLIGETLGNPPVLAQAPPA
ncbi:gamma-glutamyl-gamma-aminobutyrate hydrolase family protein [Sphingomonas sp. PAMC 26605]|uniref:gamma-glutamyl-gamma-aminobutyrate hydrolase family protein n=1 Tax=Sphingomonas sp. PAMC 26605 TaxID=1112214 RepID=UPI00026CD5EC|nr:gamma-glutamyl-gamma-aminobutyrate hydrolase family protein [Sphingomonas sp. PAMC 26605]